jgi:hypothetical protein
VLLALGIGVDHDVHPAIDEQIQRTSWVILSEYQVPSLK